MKNNAVNIKNEMLRDTIKTSCKFENRFSIDNINNKEEKIATTIIVAFNSLLELLAYNFILYLP